MLHSSCSNPHKTSGKAPLPLFNIRHQTQRAEIVNWGEGNGALLPPKDVKVLPHDDPGNVASGREPFLSLLVPTAVWVPCSEHLLSLCVLTIFGDNFLRPCTHSSACLRADESWAHLSYLQKCHRRLSPGTDRNSRLDLRCIALSWLSGACRLWVFFQCVPKCA